MEFEDIKDIASLDAATHTSFIEWFKKKYAIQFSAVKRNRAAIPVIVAHFLADARRINLTHGEYTDYLCVDTPNILEMAGLSLGEIDRVVTIFDQQNGALNS